MIPYESHYLIQDGGKHSSTKFAGQEASINRHINGNRQEYNNLRKSGVSDLQIRAKLRQKHNNSAGYHQSSYVSNANKRNMFRTYKKNSHKIVTKHATVIVIQ